MSDRSKMMLAWPVAGFFVVIAFGVGLIAEAAFGGSTVATQTVAAAASDGGETVDVTLGDLFIKPAKITAPAGATLNVTNEGQVDHNFVVTGGPSTPMIAPGDSQTLDLGELKPGTYDF
ncbi:MAG: cupredoxin domain-containing protein, partial [Actinomycetota bacterium]